MISKDKMISKPSQSNSTLDRLRVSRKRQSEKFSRYFLLAILIGISFVFFNMVKIFLVPVLLAAVFTTLFYPLYENLLRLFRNRKALSSLVCCIILLLGLLSPVYIVADLVSQEAIAFYPKAQQQIREIVQKGDEGILGKIKTSKWVQLLNLDEVNWQSTLQDIAGAVSSLLATVINETSRGTFQILAQVFITFFTMFYFFMDGEALISRLKYLSPLDSQYEDAIFSRFASVSRATIKGTLLIGLIKGILGGLILWIFGVGSPVLWGVIMVILSIIPMIGSWLVLYPAAVIQIVTGHIWQGIAIFLITTVVIINIDNVLGPRLIGQDTGMHDLMIFFSTLGGINMFGAMGFIIGPVVAVLFLTVLDIYSMEFKYQLDIAHGDLPEEELEENKME